MMKQILPICNLILFIAFFASNVHSQSILFQSDGGELSVNGNVIALDALPKDLEFGEIDFSLQAISTFPMRVEINGKSYEIWEDRIIAASEAGNVHYRLSIGADGSFVSVESTGVLDFYGIENILSRQNGAVISPGMQIWDSLEYVANLLAPSPPPPPTPLNPPPPPTPPNLLGAARKFQDFALFIPQNMAALQRGATKMLQFSSYLTNVRDASGELYELLRHEWRKEAEAMEMARKVRMMQPGAEYNAAIDELEEKLTEIFVMKQKNRRMEIEHLKAELEGMEERLKERQRVMSRLIDARLDELLLDARQ